MIVDLPMAARYNQWANRRIYDASMKLDDAARKEDRGAFFKSIHNTLNHVLLSDLIYRERLEKKPTSFSRLDEVLYGDFEDLRAAHAANDAWYVGFADSMDEETLAGTLSFDTVETGEHFSLPLRTCLANLFEHQIHHRGQTHHMLSHAGIDPPPLDIVKFASGEP